MKNQKEVTSDKITIFYLLVTRNVLINMLSRLTNKKNDEIEDLLAPTVEKLISEAPTEFIDYHLDMSDSISNIANKLFDIELIVDKEKAKKVEKNRNQK